MKSTYRNILDQAARQHVPDEINILPRIAAQLEMKPLVQIFRTRPVLAILVAVLSLSLVGGAVYAVGRSLGYIPGVGIVPEDSPLRVLAEPVIIKREGITLTVTQGLISSDKTILEYQVENIPESVLAKDYVEGQTPPLRCMPDDQLRLPDGTLMPLGAGAGNSWGLGFEHRHTFAPLPADMNEAVLLIPCLQGTTPGLAPEDWEIPLVFIPAPEDITILPVIKRTPSPEATAESDTGLTPAISSSPITIDQTIDVGDGYILMGSFQAITTPDGNLTSPYVWFVRINDANGDEVAYDYPEDIDLPSGTQESVPWAYRVMGEAHAWPLTISIDELEVDLNDLQVNFEFDTGLAPQPNQQWNLDEDLAIGSYHVRVLTATRTPDGYAFAFQANPQVRGIGIDIRSVGDYVPPEGGGGGGGGGAGSLGASLAYSGIAPEGVLSVWITHLMVSIPGPWSIQWQPEDAASLPTLVPQDDATACLTDEIWAGARAEKPTRIPSELTGQLVVFGPNADETLYGVSLYDLATESHTFLAEGSWPVSSPDGTKIIFTGNDGLAIYDRTTGETRTLPGTTPYDFRMTWSPDSARIAYIRSSTDQVMMIGSDGSGLQQVRDNTAIYHALVGWADSSHIVITEPGQQGVNIQSLSVVEWSTEDLFTISSNKADTVISPDQQWIAFTDSLGGIQGNGLYISHLDGSNRRLMAALDGRALYFPVWSPDSRWLIVSLPDSSDTVDQMGQVLVELETCRVSLLPDVGGDVFSWSR